MATTINGRVTTGVTLSNLEQNPLSVTATGYVTNTAGGDAVYGSAAAAWTVTNLGTINGTGTSGTGILLRAGGSVTNGQSGAVAGLIEGNAYGVEISGTGGTLINFGTIEAAGAAGSAFGLGVRLAVGGSVTNLGTIEGIGPNAFGVDIQQGNVTNGQSGSSAGLIIAPNKAVAIYGSGTVTNFGTIEGAGSVAFAVLLDGGGSVANFGVANFGIVEGSGSVAIGILAIASAGTVDNHGTIEETGSTSSGVSLGAGGAVTNRQGGLITGGESGVVAMGSATVVNYGTITGTGTAGIGVVLGAGESTLTNAGMISGASGTAVAFNGGGNRVILDRGEAFSGVVHAGSGSDVFELAAGNGTGTVVGSFSGFGVLTEDAGASWQMPGQWSFVTGSIATGAVLELPATTFAFTGGLTNSGTVDIESGARLMLFAGGSGSGSIAFASPSDVLQIGSAGHPAALANPITGFAPGDTIDLAGLVANGETYAGGVLTLSNSGNVVAQLTLATPVTSPVFTLGSDGNGGTLVAVRAQPVGTVVLTAATEGTALPGTTTMATFTDSNPDDTAGNFTASINWGDGTTTAGAVGGGNGSFTVAGGHTYADEGSEALSVTLSETGASGSATGTVAVAEGDTLVAHPVTFTASAKTPFSGTVATFTDTTYPDNAAGDFTATINWGDGSVPTSGTVSGGDGSFTVSGSHTYTTATPAAGPPDTVTVTLRDDPTGSATATAASTATVRQQLTGTVTLKNATEGTALPATTTVASFTDSNPDDAAGNFTATIAWGDGTTTTGTVSGSNGAFTVAGGHTYADEGSDTLSVAISETGASTTPSGTVTVAEGDVLTPHGMAISATVGKTFSGAVASFTDSYAGNLAGDFTATINWGDGSAPTSGTVSGGDGSPFIVAGTHTYSTKGTDTVAVTLNDDPPGGMATATADSTANVGPPIIIGTVVLTAATEGTALPGTTTVATFTDSNPDDTAGNFTASINWGDGTTTAGTVGGGNGSFTVAGGHTYADEGSEALSVTLSETGASGSATGTVAVAEGDTLVAHPVTFTASAKTPFSGTVATFTDTTYPDNAAGDFTATINWGDGTTTAGTVAGGNGSPFTVSGSHTYAAAGPDTVAVTLSDAAPGTATATAASTAIVTPPVSTLFDFVFTYKDGKDYYYGAVADNGTFGYSSGERITTAAGQYDIFAQAGTTSEPAGTVSVTYYSHGGPGQASYTPVLTAAGEPDGSKGLGSESDSLLGADGLQHPFSGSTEAGFTTSSLYGFVFNYSDGADYYFGTVADAGNFGYAAIANSASPYRTISDGYYYIFSEGVTGEPSGTVIINGYRDGGNAATFPTTGNGSAGLGSESGFFTVDGTQFNFSPTQEATDPTAPDDFYGTGRSALLWQNAGGSAAIWEMNGTSVIGGGVLTPNPGPSWHIKGSGDFNANGYSDILWQNNDGSAAIWEMNGTNVIASGILTPNPGPSWHIEGSGDFYGNGYSDILWQNDDGSVTIWEMNGTDVIGGGILTPNPGPSWHAVGTGDFYGNGHSDILWQNDDGSVAIWEMNGTNVIGGGIVAANPGPSWHIKGTGDFYGNGYSDILWQNNDGSAAIWEMNGTNIVSGGVLAPNPGPGWQVIGTGDYYGNSHTDILWQNDDGIAAIWEMKGTTVIGGGVLAPDPGPSWQVMGTGDYSSTDPSLVWQNDDGSVAIWDMKGTNVVGSDVLATNPGPSWHIKGTGDFYGNGDTDILWQNDDGSAAIWEINGTNVVASGIVAANPGPSWHIKGAGDFYGNGDTDILWQNDNGEAAIWEMNGTNIVSGILTPNPGPSWHIEGSGDFYGDGHSDILWQNDDGSVAMWEMDGTNIVASGIVAANPGPNWHIKGTGDFYGNGYSDILWQNDDGSAAIWEMNGTNIVGSGILTPNPGPGWQIVGVGNYGDGRPDILWQNADGQAAIWLMSGTTPTLQTSLEPNPGTTWHLQAG